MQEKKEFTSIARKVGIGTILLLALIVSLIAVIANIIILNIDKEASLEKAHSLSMNVADMFHSYLNDDLLLVRKASMSQDVTTWFAEEENDQRKNQAFNEMMDYANLLQGKHLNFGIHGSKNEYSVDSGIGFSSFIPRGVLQSQNLADSWYFDCVEGKNQYQLNFDYDKFSEQWLLWINHKVVTNGQVTGVFSSGLQVSTLFHDMFGLYDEKTIKGYIINDKGIIQMDSTFYEKYQSGIRREVFHEIGNPIFTAEINNHIDRIDGLFSSSASTITMDLGKGQYRYASITPIAGTDWAAVILYNSNLLSGASSFMPMFIFLAAALLLYVLGQNALMNRLIFKPLNQLTQVVHEGLTSEGKINEIDRSDEIGYLARTIRDTTKEIEYRGKIVSAANRSADLLLKSMSEKNQEVTIMECMEIIGQCLDADRVHIWQNESIDNDSYIVHKNEWISKTGNSRSPVPLDLKISYKDRLDWENTFLNHGYINGPVAGMTHDNKDFFKHFEIKSILIVPLFVHDLFWGLFSIDDCRHEHSYTDDEIDILRSVGLMIANSLLHEQMVQNIQDTAAQLEAVISNYSGIIWSVDRNNKITLLSGIYTKTLGLTPGAYEGWDLEKARKENKNLEIISRVEETSANGPQDWIFESNNKRFHAYNTPILDKNYAVTGVVGNINDVTEIILLKENLEEALIRAKDADHAKSDFLAKMSHEMRTPLNAIIGLSGLTLDRDKLEEEDRLDLEKVYNAGTTLLHTVNDILDISKITANKLELVCVEYDTASLLNDTISQSIMHIGDKPIKFIININENLPIHLFGDEIRIKQIMNNLLSNAFKYTREGSVTLDVSHNMQGETVVLTVQVKDTGIGIKPENISAVFEEYGQVDQKANRQIMGTGLGMPITKKLVEIMGGSITLESEYEKGSSFSVTIPQKFVTETVIGKEVVENLKSFHFSNRRRQQTTTQNRIKLPYAKVLVVDDVQTNLDVAKGLMKAYAMQIDCMSSGQQAYDSVRAANVKYNAIFMDHMMPGMDGIETTKLIRELGTEYAKNVPIIALTANAIVGNDNMFMQNGFNDFLSKPIEIARLDTVIKEWVRNDEQEKQYIAEHGKIEEANQNENQSSNEPDMPEINIEGLDIAKGLSRYNGDKETYMGILRSFAANTAELLKRTENPGKENIKDYTTVVHGIKSSSRSIGAEALGNNAEALEKAGKSGDLEFINSNNAVFNETAAKMINDINAVLNKLDEGKNKPKKEKPDNDLLSRLMKACEDYEMDDVDEVMQELNKYDYDSGSELMEWLRKEIKLVNFKQVIEKLTEVL